MIFLAAVVAGGAAAVIRYLVTQAFRGRGGLPWAVFLVNVVGAALAGVAAGWAVTGVISSDLRLVVIGGVAGGLTTFSTWSTESVQLALSGRWGRAALNVGLNLVVGLTAASLGFLAAGGLG
jgi:CrcB protein